MRKLTQKGTKSVEKFNIEDDTSCAREDLGKVLFQLMNTSSELYEQFNYCYESSSWRLNAQAIEELEAGLSSMKNLLEDNALEDYKKKYMRELEYKLKERKR